MTKALTLLLLGGALVMPYRALAFPKGYVYLVPLANLQGCCESFQMYQYLGGTNNPTEFTITVSPPATIAGVSGPGSPAPTVTANSATFYTTVGGEVEICFNNVPAKGAIVTCSDNGDAYPTSLTNVLSGGCGSTDPVSMACGADIITNCVSDAGTEVCFALPTATDSSGCKGLSVSASWPGLATPYTSSPVCATFPIGVTPVTITATDTCGHSNTCGFSITVIGHGNLEGAWVFSDGGSPSQPSASSVQGNDLALDSLGNSLVAGTFTGTATFTGLLPMYPSVNGGSPITLYSASATVSDAFVAKYDNTGHLLWVQKAGSAGNASGHGVAVDAQGNCFVTGNFENYIFPNLATLCDGGPALGITAVGPQDMFLAKYDPQGNLLWAVNGADTNGIGAISGMGVAVDGSGDCFVTGSFQSNAWLASIPDLCEFPAIPQLSGVSANSDAYLAKYDAAGIYLWAQQSHCASPSDAAVSRRVTVDESGENAWIVGNFTGEVFFNTATSLEYVQSYPSGFISALVVKYTNVSANPSVGWARQTSSPCNISTASTNCGIADGIGVGVDSSDNCYFTAYYNGGASLGAFTVHDRNTIYSPPYQFSQNQLYDYLVGSLDQNGNARWLINSGQTNDNESRGLTVTPAGNVYVTGLLDSYSEFGIEGQNILLNAYDSTGALMWIGTGQGGLTSPQLNAGWGVAVDGAGCVYATGGFDDQAVSDPGLYFPGLKPIASTGQESMFLVKFCSACSTGGGGGCTTLPALFVPANITVDSCTNIPVTYSAFASSPCCTNVQVVCTPASGSTFYPGSTTTVTCVATDCNGLKATNSFSVTVKCCAPTPLNLFNTGVDAFDALLPGGSKDPNYTLTTNPNGGPSPTSAYVVDPIISGWLPNDYVSQWIGPATNGGNAAGTYTYQTPFYVDCDHGLVIITGQWAADNDGSIFIDSPTNSPVSILLSSSTDFNQWYPFSYTGGLSAGLHELVFVVTNIADGEPANPTGLRAEMKGTLTCCVNCSPTNTVSLNTGSDHTSGNLYPVDDQDAYWTLTAEPGATGGKLPRPATVIANDAAWPKAQAGSQWISSYPSSIEKVNGEFDFQTYFCLESDATNVVLSIYLRADDEATAYLNGHPIPLTGSTAFNASSPAHGTVDFSANPSWFTKGGQNVLKVAVMNTGAGAMGFNLTGTVTGAGMTVGQPDCCQPFSGLSGKYYYDGTGTGMVLPGQPTLPAITMNLYIFDTNGVTNYVTNTVTDTTGFYTFQGLTAGTYMVAPEPISGLLQASPAAGSYTVTLGVAQQVGAQDFVAIKDGINNGCFQITGPGNIVAQCNGAGANVFFDVTATSLCETNPITVTTEPYSGYYFPVGTTTVYCSAIDANYNSTNYSFTVTVDCNAGLVFSNPPPAAASYACLGDVPPPPFVTASTECPSGATVTFSQTESNPQSPCSNILTRTWTATDQCGDTNTFTETVMVVNTNAPVIAGLSNIVLTSSTNIAVDYTLTASSVCCGILPVVCVPASGSVFAPGTVTTVQCTATDCCSNTATGSFTVSVQPPQTFAPPVIQSVSRSGLTLTFTWGALTNQVYLIQSASDLSLGQWTQVGRPITATSNSMSVTEPLATNGQMFYRVVLVP